jgi:hypothetical protein
LTSWAARPRVASKPYSCLVGILINYGPKMGSIMMFEEYIVGWRWMETCSQGNIARNMMCMVHKDSLSSLATFGQAIMSKGCSKELAG